MATQSRLKPSRRNFAALAVLLVVAVLLPQAPPVNGAEPIAPVAPPPTRAIRIAQGARHILVQLHPHADERRFMQQAQAQGLRQIKRVYGTTWIKMAIPAGSTPAQAVAAARKLPGVLRATKDVVVTINDQIPPRDPFYKDDDDPRSEERRVGKECRSGWR